MIRRNWRSPSSSLPIRSGVSRRFVRPWALPGRRSIATTVLRLHMPGAMLITLLTLGTLVALGTLTTEVYWPMRQDLCKRR